MAYLDACSKAAGDNVCDDCNVWTALLLLSPAVGTVSELVLAGGMVRMMEFDSIEDGTKNGEETKGVVRLYSIERLSTMSIQQAGGSGIPSYHCGHDQQQDSE